MTQNKDNNLMEQLVGLVGKEGLDSFLNAFRLLINEAMFFLADPGP